MLGGGGPASEWGAGASPNKGDNASARFVEGNKSGVKLDMAPQDRKFLDWIRVINAASEPNTLKGERANVIGSVSQDSRLGDGTSTGIDVPEQAGETSLSPRPAETLTASRKVCSFWRACF